MDGGDRTAEHCGVVAVAVGLDARMSNLYEQWQPSVGDRVRVVMRDETGAAIEAGRTGTIVSVRRDPQLLCEVEYDSPSGPNQARERQAHSMTELEPVEEPAILVTHRERERSGPTAGAGPAWQPTVGDRVVTAVGNLAGTITAVDERDDDTVCEVAYDHQSGEPEQPRRASYSVRELTPLGEPSAEVLEDDQPQQEPAR